MFAQVVTIGTIAHLATPLDHLTQRRCCELEAVSEDYAAVTQLRELLTRGGKDLQLLPMSSSGR